MVPSNNAQFLTSLEEVYTAFNLHQMVELQIRQGFIQLDSQQNTKKVNNTKTLVFLKMCVPEGEDCYACHRTNLVVMMTVKLKCVIKLIWWSLNVNCPCNQVNIYVCLWNLASNNIAIFAAQNRKKNSCQEKFLLIKSQTLYTKNYNCSQKL